MYIQLLVTNGDLLLGVVIMSQEYTKQVYSAKCLQAPYILAIISPPTHAPFELSLRWEGDITQIFN